MTFMKKRRPSGWTALFRQTAESCCAEIDRVYILKDVHSYNALKHYPTSTNHNSTLVVCAIPAQNISRLIKLLDSLVTFE